MTKPRLSLDSHEDSDTVPPRWSLVNARWPARSKRSPGPPSAEPRVAVPGNTAMGAGPLSAHGLVGLDPVRGFRPLRTWSRANGRHRAGRLRARCRGLSVPSSFVCLRRLHAAGDSYDISK